MNPYNEILDCYEELHARFPSPQTARAWLVVASLIIVHKSADGRQWRTADGTRHGTLRIQSVSPEWVRWLEAFWPADSSPFWYSAERVA